ncbi:MAG: hypothetical protein JXQ91_03870 [Vannielia sp.]|uniref:pilus assembly protein TadG-related protein n=1 Tax=Vannielia sp. TaxID=2813045 RepID=UPI003B8E81AC
MQGLRAKLAARSVPARAFAAAEEGAISALGIFVFLVSCVVYGVAVDVARVRSAQSQLQLAADTAAHAALYYRETHNAEEAREKALAVANYGMPRSIYGNTLVPEDIVFGSWSYESETFLPDPDSRESVMVTTRRLKENGTSLATTLFGFVGIDSFDVVSRTVFTTYRPTCFREGFVAEDVVDIQSNNNYYAGFCIHANGHVELNSNNVFEAGTIVSMPNIDDLVLPQSGFSTNDGLKEALRVGSYRIRVINRLPATIQGLYDADDAYLPDYITSPVAVGLSGSKLDESDFTPGRLHLLSGSSNCKVTLSPSVPLREVVFVTNCEIKFSQGTALQDVVIATTNTGAKSMNAPSTLQVGKDDICAEGGGAQLLSLGGMSFASDLRMYGGQLVALGDIIFAANAEGIEGASMISGRRIDGTSNMNMGFCVTGMEDNFEASYFRLAY